MFSIALFLIASSLIPNCASYGEMSVATNHADDIAGQPDTRPGTWGTAGSAAHTVTFHPPAGCSVRILRVYGDVVAWPVGDVERGRTAGVLWGLQTTAPEGSRWADPAADNTMLYLQFGTRGELARIPVDVQVSGGRLGPDHVLVSKVAAWLNDTGKPIHIEPSFVVVFRFEN